MTPGPARPLPLRRSDQMVQEFDEAVFMTYDTGRINPGNEAFIYEPKYEVGELIGPIKTKFGYHLIKIDTCAPDRPLHT